MGYDQFSKRCPRGHIHKQRESCAVCAEQDRERLHASVVAVSQRQKPELGKPPAWLEAPPTSTQSIESAFESAHRQLAKDAARLACTHDFDELRLLCTKCGTCAFNEMWLARERSHRGRNEPVAGCNCKACEATLAMHAVRGHGIKELMVDEEVVFTEMPVAREKVRVIHGGREYSAEFDVNANSRDIAAYLNKQAQQQGCHAYALDAGWKPCGECAKCKADAATFQAECDKSDRRDD